MNRADLLDATTERKLIYQFLGGTNNGYFRVAMDSLTADDFSDAFCQDCFTVMLSLAQRGTSVDAASVYVEAQRLGIKLDNAKLFESETDLGYPPELINYLAELASRRKMYDKMLISMDAILDYAIPLEETLSDLKTTTELIVKANDDVIHIAEVGTKLLKECEQRYNGDDMPGIMSGFSYIDNKGGLQPSDLNIIAGRTSHGKSSFAMSIALNVSRSGTPVAVYSLEMSLKQLASRLTSITSGVNASRIQFQRLSYGEFDLVLKGAYDVMSQPIYFDRKNPKRFRAIESSIRRLVMYKQVKCVIIDYIQLIVTEDKDTRIAMSNISNTLKSLAVELDICIIALSQLSRNTQGSSDVPSISQMKESAAIEQAADNIYMVYRPEINRKAFPDMSQVWSKYDTHNMALVINGKSRNNAIGEFLTNFNPDTTLFSDSDTFNLATITETIPKSDLNPF